MALGLSVSGCSLFGDDPTATPAGDSSTAGVVITEAPPDTLASLQSVLDRRAAAVRRGDERSFLAGLARHDQQLRTEQRVLFDNLRQLPLAAFDYRIDQTGLLRQGEDYRVVVEERLQLEGFDRAPVMTLRRFLFTPGNKPGRFLLAETSDLAWDVENRIQRQPWDLGPIVVSRGQGVLGIFDQGSVRASRQILASAQRSISQVAAVVPSAWSRTVVIYALSTTSALTALPEVPGGDPTGLDAVSFPVFVDVSDASDPQLASTRVALHPRILDERARARDRLIRHELTHVAIGAGDDHAPVWLSEGLAEYVSVQSLAPEQRTIAASAIEDARAGITEMPDDETFNDSGTSGSTSANYGIAWFACEYLASSYGEVSLWQLLAELNDPDVDPDEVLLERTGINSRTLARKAAKLLLVTYDPPEPDPTPSPTPSDAASGPTSSASPSGSASGSASGSPSGSPSGNAGGNAGASATATPTAASSRNSPHD